VSDDVGSFVVSITVCMQTISPLAPILGEKERKMLRDTLRLPAAFRCTVLAHPLCRGLIDRALPSTPAPLHRHDVDPQGRNACVQDTHRFIGSCYSNWAVPTGCCFDGLLVDS